MDLIQFLASLLGPPSSSVRNGGAATRKRTRYRCRDGRSDFGFEFARMSDGSWRTYIADSPGYGSRDSSLHATHRLRDGHGYYVCWTVALRTEDEARQVAKAWAENTVGYIATGKRF